jgi:hypothetical protein
MPGSKQIPKAQPELSTAAPTENAAPDISFPDFVFRYFADDIIVALAEIGELINEHLSRKGQDNNSKRLQSVKRGGS